MKKKQQKRDKLSTVATQKCHVDILLKELELEWNDHFEIRRQTWRTVSASGALVIALIGVNLTIEHTTAGSLMLILGCIGLFFVCIFGIIISIHHRGCEKDKFAIIRAIEKRLPVDNNTETTLFSLANEATGGKVSRGHHFFSTSSFIIVYHVTVGFVLFMLFLLTICTWYLQSAYPSQEDPTQNSEVHSIMTTRVSSDGLWITK